MATCKTIYRADFELTCKMYSYDRVGQPGDGSSAKNFPPFFRPFPFFPTGYYFNNRRGRGRGKRGHHY